MLLLNLLLFCWFKLFLISCCYKFIALFFNPVSGSSESGGLLDSWPSEIAVLANKSWVYNYFYLVGTKFRGYSPKFSVQFRISEDFQRTENIFITKLIIDKVERMEEFFFIYIEKWIEKDINLYRIYCQKKTWWCGRSNSKNSPGSRFCPSFILQQSLLNIPSIQLPFWPIRSHGVFLRPFTSQRIVSLSISLIYARNLGHQRIVRIWITEQWANWQQNWKIK